VKLGQPLFICGEMRDNLASNTPASVTAKGEMILYCDIACLLIKLDVTEKKEQTCQKYIAPPLLPATCHSSRMFLFKVSSPGLIPCL
jgi:hypothetical protein